jgi:hypothetical protein
VGSDPALLRLTVLDADRAKVGRRFSAAVSATALASYPGLYALTPPGDGSSYGVYWPTTVPASLVTARVIINGEPAWSGPAQAQPPDPAALAWPSSGAGPEAPGARPVAARLARPPGARFRHRRVPLGTAGALRGRPQRRHGSARPGVHLADGF